MYVLVVAVERSCGCGVEHMIVMAYGERYLLGLNVEVNFFLWWHLECWFVGWSIVRNYCIS